MLSLGVPDCEAIVSLGVTPPIVELEVPAGGDEVVELKVFNGGDSRLSVTAYASAIKLGPEGTPVPLEKREGKWSCADWISLDQDKFELLHGERKLVRATLKVPHGAKGGRYAAILFEAMPTAAQPGTGDITVGTRVGTIVLQTIPRTLERSGKIESVKVAREAADTMQFVVRFMNTGNVHVKARGSVLIKNSEGDMIDRVPLEVGTGTVLPDGIREFRGVWSNPRRMKKGEYTGEVRVSCPGMGEALASVDFSIE
jgi:hypothetical protein